MHHLLVIGHAHLKMILRIPSLHHLLVIGHAHLKMLLLLNFIGHAHRILSGAQDFAILRSS